MINPIYDATNSIGAIKFTYLLLILNWINNVVTSKYIIPITTKILIPLSADAYSDPLSVKSTIDKIKKLNKLEPKTPVAAISY